MQCFFAPEYIAYNKRDNDLPSREKVGGIEERTCSCIRVQEKVTIHRSLRHKSVPIAISPDR